MSTRKCIAFFVSSHGFGHAARVAAIMSAIRDKDASIGFRLFTTVPRWFFEEDLAPPFDYCSIHTDVGLIQKNSLEEDIPSTISALERFIPFDPELLDNLAAELLENNIIKVVVDISPLGIAVANRANLPSMLIENFTWDWIYGAYSDEWPALESFVGPMSRLFDSVDQRVQVVPYCRSVAGSMVVPPLSRRTSQTPSEVRHFLELPADRPIVLLTMGGVAWRYTFLDRLREADDLSFVVPGGAGQPTKDGNLVLLPFRTRFRHADLVGAADVVVGKLGYSTLAEVYRSGIPYLYVPRPRFPESPVLEGFARRHLPCDRIEGDSFERGTWIDAARSLARHNRISTDNIDSAGMIAGLLLDGS